MISATDNPAAANDAVEKFLSGAKDEAPTPKVPEAPDTVVSLPGGMVDRISGQVIREAEVRELTGADEEALAKVANHMGRYLDVLLTRGVVSLGGEKATKETLDRLLAGDRDALLVAIRKATFGKALDLNMECPHCEAKLDAEIDLDEDVPSSRLEDPVTESQFDVELDDGRTATVNLPTIQAQREIAMSGETNSAKLDTILLSRCVAEIDGVPTIGSSGLMTIRNLGMKDRKRLLKEIVERNPGPRLSETKVTCPQCDEEFAVPLNLMLLFRL